MIYHFNWCVIDSDQIELFILLIIVTAIAHPLLLRGKLCHNLPSFGGIYSPCHLVVSPGWGTVPLLSQLQHIIHMISVDDGPLVSTNVLLLSSPHLNGPSVGRTLLGLKGILVDNFKAKCDKMGIMAVGVSGYCWWPVTLLASSPSLTTTGALSLSDKMDDLLSLTAWVLILD